MSSSGSRPKITGKSTDGPISRLINRRVSTRITSVIVKYGVPLTPNQVSIISFLMGVISGYLFATGRPLLAGVLAQLSSIVDGVDGELARATGKASRAGGFLDAILDRYADIAVLTGLILLALQATHGNTLVLILGLAALAGDIMVSYLHARGEASLGTHPVFLGKMPQLASRDVRLFIVFLGGVFARPVETLAVLAVLSNTYVVIKTLECYLEYKAIEEKHKAVGRVPG